MGRVSYSLARRKEKIWLEVNKLWKNNDINKLIELGTKNDSTQKIEIKRINDSIEVNIEKETFLKIKIRTNTTC